MADVNETDLPETDLPESVTAELRRVVEGHCLRLYTMEKLLGTPERSKLVAQFMKKMTGELLCFTLAERALLIRFISETEEVTLKAIEAAGCLEKPLNEVKKDLASLFDRMEQIAFMSESEEEE
jgi:hypothetical protein